MTRNHRILETRLVVGMLQCRRNKVSITGAAMLSGMQGQVHDGVLAENATKLCNMQGIHGIVEEHVFDIDTAQHNACNRAMALAELHSKGTLLLLTSSHG